MREPSEEQESVCASLRAALLKDRGKRAYWVGALSPSALATATAVSALSLAGRESYAERIRRGLAWLSKTQNQDGGWGDTPRSRSNISTSWLVRAAFAIAAKDSQTPNPFAESKTPSTGRSLAYLAQNGGCGAIAVRYGEDKTFSAPILMNLAIAGLVPWDECPQLPFWLAALPRPMLQYLGLRVVSYALPALVAVGLANFTHRRGGFFAGLAGKLAKKRALALLARITPKSGGYLEATPLTSFVVMGLVAAGERSHPALAQALGFLCSEQDQAGAWKIDRDLAIWLTTASVCALGEGEPGTRDWLLEQQAQKVHPFTGCAPGAWGWTNSSGSVPDADDTAGALLALRLSPEPEKSMPAAEKAVNWLLNLQNSDGGWPTFCRGWQKLPFDRSCPDITAHVLRAFMAWRPLLKKRERPMSRASERGWNFLARSQRPDGSWTPLWFGNEHVANDENPVFGTARVLPAYRDAGFYKKAAADSPVFRATAFLLAAQNDDGSWGGARGVPGSIEETAVACEALRGLAPGMKAREKGLGWLCRAIQAGDLDGPAPIGLYFSRLWYFEKLYPMIFSLAAMRQMDSEPRG